MSDDAALSIDAVVAALRDGPRSAFAVAAAIGEPIERVQRWLGGTQDLAERVAGAAGWCWCLTNAGQKRLARITRAPAPAAASAAESALAAAAAPAAPRARQRAAPAAPTLGQRIVDALRALSGAGAFPALTRAELCALLGARPGPLGRSLGHLLRAGQVDERDGLVWRRVDLPALWQSARGETVVRSDAPLPAAAPALGQAMEAVPAGAPITVRGWRFASASVDGAKISLRPAPPTRSELLLIAQGCTAALAARDPFLCDLWSDLAEAALARLS